MYLPIGYISQFGREYQMNHVHNERDLFRMGLCQMPLYSVNIQLPTFAGTLQISMDSNVHLNDLNHLCRHQRIWAQQPTEIRYFINFYGNTFHLLSYPFFIYFCFEWNIIFTAILVVSPFRWSFILRFAVQQVVLYF